MTRGGGASAPHRLVQCQLASRVILTPATRAEPPAGLCLRLHPALVLSDPRFGVRCGLERADPGRMGIRDADLDAEGPIVQRNHAIGGRCVRMGPFCAWLTVWHCGPAQ